jgi:IMP dehydrogenase
MYIIPRKLFLFSFLWRYLMDILEALTFDDVLLVPAQSTVLPANAQTNTNLTRDIKLGVPLLSAAMDTVTEAQMAIAMAQFGGIGVIHKNFTQEEQAKEVRKVKKSEAGMVINPITIYPDQTLQEALDMRDAYHISGFPVVERGTEKLVGILTHRDVRFAKDKMQPVSNLMTKENLITVKENSTSRQAKDLLHKHRIEKLIVVDDNYKCVGLITVKDLERSKNHPNASKDNNGRLLVAAATGVGEAGIERATHLIKAEADVIVVDTAHGHSAGVMTTVEEIKRMSPNTQIIAGNIATPEAAEALIKAGADAVKVGIGPGSICTTRIVAGVGVPQFSAIREVAQALRGRGIPVIADGGIKNSGDFSKAIAAGANVAMIGSMLAGTDEAPGEIFLYQGRSYKAYRGMGSLGAMAKGSADRYFQEKIKDSHKLVPEGIEGRVPYKGSAEAVLHQMVGGLKASMGYTGNATIDEMRVNCTFRRITNAGLQESHVHDVAITKEAPNYKPIGY